MNPETLPPASATLEDILITGELSHRRARGPDFETENQALVVLAQELAGRPENLLRRLVEVAVELGLADSVGISILDQDEDPEVFRWAAIAGRLAHELNGTIPRRQSPCGLVIERDDTLLLDQPGRHFPALASLEPPAFENLLVPFHHGGRPVGTVWLIAHTEERRFDSEDVRLLGSLSRFASAGYQMATSLRSAQQASHAKSQFLAMMSHELRTPLNSVIAYAELLGNEVLGPMTQKQQEALSRITGGSWHLVGIIDEVLTLSRMEAGKEAAQLEEADVAELTRQIVQMFVPMIGQQSLRLTLEGADRPLRLRTDAAKVRQILTNLIGNAVKFTTEGEIRVHLDAEAPDRLAIHIHDTGTGIPARQQERIFEPFTQVDGSHTRSTPGMGLGLAICRRLAFLLGGEVTLRSELGHGSTFTLRLPAAGVEPAEGR